MSDSCFGFSLPAGGSAVDHARTSPGDIPRSGVDHPPWWTNGVHVADYSDPTAHVAKDRSGYNAQFFVR
jgi:hypothetical protein